MTVYLKQTVLSFLFIAIAAFSVPAEPWWSSEKLHETKEILPGITYQRIEYTTITSEPVQAHIVSATGLEKQYIFGVLGSFGTHFTPSQFSEQSGAVVAVNGGFFQTNPSRALGLVAAHGRLLYPPIASKFLGTVGFHSKGLLIDWITSDDVNGFRINSAKEGWNNCHAALGAGPILVQDRKSKIEPTDDPFYTTRHPRSGIGVKPDGEAIIIVVDGRQAGWSAGVSLDEFAHIFLEHDASGALNLDGGGSSTLVINNQVTNRPSDFAMPNSAGKERAVANVITLFRREQ